VRLRPLTEAECYARCYGGRREETVSVVRIGEAADAVAADGRDHRGPLPEHAEASEAA
jgi:hypothetical protein